MRRGASSSAAQSSLRRVDAICLRNIGQRLTGIDAGQGFLPLMSIQRIRPPSPVDKTERFCAARSVPTIVHTNRVRMEPKIPARRGAAPVTVRRPATHSSAGLSWSTVKDVLRVTERRLHHALETVAA